MNINEQKKEFINEQKKEFINIISKRVKELEKIKYDNIYQKCYYEKNNSLFENRFVNIYNKYHQLLQKIYYLDDDLTIIGTIFEYEPETSTLIRIIKKQA